MYGGDDNTFLYMLNFEFSIEKITGFIMRQPYINTQDINGKTMLYSAISAERSDVAMILLELGACTNISDNDGVTATHLAANMPNLLPELVRRGANVNAIDNDGQTPLHYIVTNSDDVKAIEFLLEHGADPNVVDNNGWTPLLNSTINRDRFNEDDRRYDVMMGYVDDLHKDRGNINIDVVALLLEYGADVNVGIYGFTVLHHAASSGYVHIVKFLLSAGADVNARNSEDQTPLHLAAQEHFDVVEVLCGRHDIDIDACDNDGNTPIMWALQYGCPHNIVYLLLQMNADLGVVNNDGRLFRDYAHPEMIEYVKGLKRAKELVLMKMVPKLSNKRLIELNLMGLIGKFGISDWCKTRV